MDEWVIEFVKMYNGISLEDYIDGKSTDVYHYTSPSAFRSIITNAQLRFTDRLYLNDKSEGFYCLDLCISHLGDLTKGSDSEFVEMFRKKLEYRKNYYQKYSREKRLYVYQCSFSCDNDSLCMWNYYSKNSNILGYNLHFESTSLKDNLEMESAFENGKVPQILHGKIIYTTEKQIEIIQSIYNKFHNFWSETCEKSEEKMRDMELLVDYLIDKISFIGAFFKMKCFEIENEYRLVLYLYLEDDGSFMALKNRQDFFERAGIFIPYIDIKFAPSTLLSVCISPTMNVERTKNSILRISAGYENLKDPKNIRQSSIPVRY